MSLAYPPAPTVRPAIRHWLSLSVVVVVLAGVGATWWLFRDNGPTLNARPPAAAVLPEPPKAPEPDPKATPAPELDGGVAWLNTAGPIRLKDLRGKIVLLDFWTLCCINCIHTLPDLAKLEKKYANELVVIGVHSPKFPNERDTASIRKAILRYQISHPVVNDADRKIWDAYDADSWPTLVLIDPDGKLYARGSGEGLYNALDEHIGKLVQTFKDKKTLDQKPRKFELARFQENGDSPLFFPGKILADAASKRLFIADSTHHRIVITDLAGKKLAIAGVGEPGGVDGAFDKASFNDPQGMALQGETLYVADRKNNLIRALDLERRTVRTVAGTGEQGHDRDTGGPALKTGLNSPWALLLAGNRLFIAQAGFHQIWTLDLKEKELARYAGTGRETRQDGPLLRSAFAQPSGLATDGKNLFVADSETSSIRSLPMNGEGDVTTLVGVALFEFGDKDGTGKDVRLQHALGVAYHDGKLYVADTYNSKIKVIEPATNKCTTFVGGEPDTWFTSPSFSEPGGISYANDKLYVADTNAHRIRVVDLKTRTVSTLKLTGVEAPKPVMP